ncbi:hypothetical protein SynBMKMC1_01169 [Synechococcus sp. BMK-MC-1]|nr:hypothetical protein SynBMKMC1_01169 [Synechococcus sp. BMK-MC-1]
MVVSERDLIGLSLLKTSHTVGEPTVVVRFQDLACRARGGSMQ